VTPVVRSINQGDLKRFYYTLLGSCLIVWSIVFFLMFAMGNIDAEEVGILVNNLTGTVTVYEHPGTYFYNAITSDLHVIDKREQTLEMTANERRGDIKGVDFVRIKTRDGSDVSVDVTVNYRIIPSKAELILTESGQGGQYKTKWVRDYSRSICRNILGELSTEEFYQSDLRSEKADAAMAALNKLLEPHGIKIRNVQVQSFAFYKEYEEKIKEKKLADQEVEEEKSKAQAATEEKKRRRIEQTNRKTVEIAKFVGTLKKNELEMVAQSEKARKRSDAYCYSTKITADAKLIKLSAQSKAILAEKRAEAKGVEKMCKALAGPGGRNLVMMEYAKKLKHVTLLGQPYSLENRVDKVQHLGFIPTRGGAAK